MQPLKLTSESIKTFLLTFIKELAIRLLVLFYFLTFTVFSSNGRNYRYENKNELSCYYLCAIHVLLDLEECIRAYDTVNLMSIHNVHPTCVRDVVLRGGGGLKLHWARDLPYTEIYLSFTIIAEI